MKQVTQNLKNGQIKLEDSPTPSIDEGFLLVKNCASLISAGTEKAKVELGEKNLVQKAISRPELTKQVLQKIRQEGIISALNKVSHKLESSQPLGYSCSGEIVAIGAQVSGFSIGDRVACAGAGYANHAEFCSLPVNLAAKIPDGVDYESAAFGTLGAIAMQGVRQADPKIGENVCVIGLGLLGQITVQILSSCGCNTFGIDVDPERVALSEKLGAKKSILRNNYTTAFTDNFTNGFGFDCVIITAACASNDPLVLAGEIARDKAKIVIVGDVLIDIPRKNYYEKELQVLMSRSYGPGRYDRAYEEEGIDYPIGYVRWTEKRNIESFLELVEKEKINLKLLITHRFSLNDAPRAYDLISGKTDQPFLGVILKYDENAKITPKITLFDKNIRSHNDSTVLIGFIGAGNFASGVLLPILKHVKGIQLDSICSATGLSALNSGKRFGFRQACSDPDELIDSQENNTIFIATSHDLHSQLALRSINNGKYTFVEKPLAISREQLDNLALNSKNHGLLTVGFNRRFSPHAAFVKKLLSQKTGNCILSCRVNAGNIPKESWIHDPKIGGGRIIGEVCHFIDLMQFLSDEKIVEVTACALQNNEFDSKLNDNLVINLKFEKGSIGSIIYTAKGNIAQSKEKIEVFSDGMSFEIDNFKESRAFIKNKCLKLRTLSQDKGHKNEIDLFIKAVQEGRQHLIPFENLYNTTLATFKIIDSLKENRPVKINEPS